MDIQWLIKDSDVELVRAFVSRHRGKSFVRRRIEENVDGEIPPFTRDWFWEAMVSCLLTTQQRSGPHTAVTRFLVTKPFPLRLDACKGCPDLRSFVAETITSFGGLRRANKIAGAVAKNKLWLDGDGWQGIERHAAGLLAQRERAPRPADKWPEREAARFVSGHMAEFGPKQSRNLWQMLGYTRFETPVDSRITKWLNSIGFPVRLSANTLSDHAYYEFVMDGVQALCEACEVHPCVLDACVFASYDEEWPQETLVW